MKDAGFLRLTSLFLRNLTSSWLINVLVIGLIAAVDWGSDAALVRVALAQSVLVPFQLYLNEAIAPRTATRSKYKYGRNFLVVLLVSAMALLLSLNGRWGLAAVLTVVAGISGLALSYIYVTQYYAHALGGRVTGRANIFLAIAPGVATLCSYAGLRVADTVPSDTNVLLVLFAPQAFQLIVGRLLLPGDIDDQASTEQLVVSPLAWLMLIELCACTYIGVRSREDISSAAPSWSVVLLYLLNMLASLLIAVGRAAYFSMYRTRNLQVPLLLLFSASLTLILCTQGYGWWSYALSTMVATAAIAVTRYEVS